jgi:hypothetical protein
MDSKKCDRKEGDSHEQDSHLHDPFDCHFSVPIRVSQAQL